MKKSLVLAMAMALGISATAFAANPFSDLPAGHWAYASVAKLAAAGVVDGYPDGTFKGDKLMTRYEMAQIVAKALAKGAIGADDKLVSEFADELNNLGVRVAKLEKNADNVKITGQIRTHYANYDRDNYVGDKDGSSSKIRSRLFLTGEVNDNWHYQGMLQNEQSLINDDGDSTTSFQRAYIYGNIGAVKMTAGRFSEVMGDGNIYDNRIDAVKAEYGKNVKFTAEYGKMASDDFGVDKSAAGKFWRLGVAGKVGNNFNLSGEYIGIKDQKNVGVSTVADNNIWNLAAEYQAKDLGLGFMYLKGDADGAINDSGWVAKVSYAGAKAAKVNSWGLYGKYYDQGDATFVKHTMNGEYDLFNKNGGFKGFLLGANYTVAKNMVAAVEYYDLKAKENTDYKSKTIWSQLVVTF